MTTKTATAPKPPVDPGKYRPSDQVNHIIDMIVEGRRHTTLSTWDTERDTRFNDGARWQLNIVFRELVALETRIEDSDILDQLCGDLIEDAWLSKTD